MNTNLKPVGGSHLPARIRTAATNLLYLAADDGETLIHSRITNLESVGKPKHFMDDQYTYRLSLKGWALPREFDPEYPETLILFTLNVTGDVESLVEDCLDGSFSEFDDYSIYGNPEVLELPESYYGDLAEHLSELLSDQIEEYCAQGGGIPFDLTEPVKALYVKHARLYGANYNAEDY